MTDDLTGRHAQLRRGATSARAEIERSLACAAAAAVAPAFLRLDTALARASADAVDAACELGAPAPPLGGLAVSIKDLFDVAGQPTRAASRVLLDAAPAAQDAPVVARLRAAGAALIGRTHMTEFAFSGVGLNPHHPTPANVPMAALDAVQPRIPGGSSSGAAVSVAAGAAWAALGTDTGGSVRIPAALQGLVGYKNTQRLTPSGGMLPLAPSLDTACAITRSVRDAVLLHEVLAARRVALAGRPLHARRLALASALMLDDLEAPVAADFDRALQRLSAAGARIETVALAPLAELEPLTRGGGLPAAESWAWHRDLLARHGADYDPRVASRIRRGAALSAADVLDLQRERRLWQARMHTALAGFDAVLSPTVPLIAPPMEALLASDDGFFRINALLLRNPAVVNLLDGCAISLPCHDPGSAPVGLMLWAAGGQDDTLLDVALAVEAALARGRA